MNENFYIAHKKLPHKTLRVHRTRYTVHTCKLSQAKTTKGHSYQKVQAAPTHPPHPKSGTIHNIAVKCKNIYRVTNNDNRKKKKEKRITHTHTVIMYIFILYS